MTARHLFALSVLALSLGSSAALAQADDDDQLAPLNPSEKPSKSSKKKHKRSPKVAPEAASDDLVPLAPIKASISVNLFTPGQGARLFIDGADLGPLLPGAPPHPVSPGSHRVVVRRLGFKEFSLTVPTRPGIVAQVPVSLEPEAGVVAVQANVPDAEVWVDGRRLGPAPLKDVLLPPGEHDVQVRRNGYQVNSSRLSVHAGKEYAVRAHLEPLAKVAVAQADRPERERLTPAGVAAPAEGPLEGANQPQGVAASTPWYGQWYVWTGVGAVAAAATVGIVMATQPHALDPNQVCRPAPCVSVINDPRNHFLAAPLVRF